MPQPAAIRLAVSAVISLFTFTSLFLTVSDRIGVVGAALLAVAALVVSYLFFALLLGRVVKQVEPKSTPMVTPEAKKQTSQRSLAAKEEELIDDTYTVEAGGYEDIKLGVGKGDLIVGHLRETYGQPFTWFIADEENFVDYVGDNNYDTAQKGEDVSPGKVRWRVPRDDSWHLVLDAYGKQNDREIVVDLRRKRG